MEQCVPGAWEALVGSLGILVCNMAVIVERSLWRSRLALWWLEILVVVSTMEMGCWLGSFVWVIQWVAAVAVPPMVCLSVGRKCMASVVDPWVVVAARARPDQQVLAQWAVVLVLGQVEVLVAVAAVVSPVVGKEVEAVAKANLQVEKVLRLRV